MRSCVPERSASLSEKRFETPKFWSCALRSIVCSILKRGNARIVIASEALSIGSINCHRRLVSSRSFSYTKAYIKFVRIITPQALHNLYCHLVESYLQFRETVPLVWQNDQHFHNVTRITSQIIFEGADAHIILCIVNVRKFCCLMHHSYSLCRRGARVECLIACRQLIELIEPNSYAHNDKNELFVGLGIRRE